MPKLNRRQALALGAAAAVIPTRFAIAQARKPLRFIPTADLSALDPHWTTTQTVQTHGFYVFDTLYGVDSQLRPHPQMAEGTRFPTTTASGTSSCGTA